MQLQDILFSQGFGTRRVCCGLVQQGRVTVGEPPRPATDPTEDLDPVGLVFQSPTAHREAETAKAHRG